jgi:hypothetical protein
MSHQFRPQLLDKINGVILLGDKDTSIKASLFKWLGMRRIYLINMKIVATEFYLHQSSIDNDYVDQFRYIQIVVMRGQIRDETAIFIISHCPCLLSMDKGNYSRPSPKVSVYILQSIADHCSGLQSLYLRYCGGISDDGLITISEHCPNLQLIDLAFGQITDANIISISSHFPRLKSLDLEGCQLITDASIISMSTHCIGLQSLNVYGCRQITDACIVSISTYCTGLQSLNLGNCNQITHASILSISTHCTGLQSLFLYDCPEITDASIISISENCTGLKRLNISYTNITHASLIAIANNCTVLQLLFAGSCSGLSSNELRHEFNSVDELRAALLSIYPYNELSSIKHQLSV